MSKVLVYTVSRANTINQINRAKTCLREGIKTAGINHDWILYCNSPQLLEASKHWWERLTWGDGVNKGQHIALQEVLAFARANGYDYIVKVDDDITWMTRGWLKKLVAIEEQLFAVYKKHSLVAPRVRGLKNPIPIMASIKLEVAHGKIPLHVMPILGGACRLHHISFFDDYTPDCRRAMGAGGDTSIAQHAEASKVPMFAAHWVNVRHNTANMEEADPDYFKLHGVFQVLPYIPIWRVGENNV